jgi:hypothetical protein
LRIDLIDQAAEVILVEKLVRFKPLFEFQAPVIFQVSCGIGYKPHLFGGEPAFYHEPVEPGHGQIFERGSHQKIYRDRLLVEVTGHSNNTQIFLEPRVNPAFGYIVVRSRGQKECALAHWSQSFHVPAEIPTVGWNGKMAPVFLSRP